MPFQTISLIEAAVKLDIPQAKEILQFGLSIGEEKAKIKLFFDSPYTYKSVQVTPWVL